jgi:hypothetical protein
MGYIYKAIILISITIIYTIVCIVSLKAVFIPSLFQLCFWGVVAPTLLTVILWGELIYSFKKNNIESYRSQPLTLIYLFFTGYIIIFSVIVIVIITAIWNTI